MEQKTTVQETKEIEIVKVKEVKYNNSTFLAYECVDKHGKLMTVKFVKGCPNIPERPCVILVKPENMNVDKSRRYPCLWVKAVEEIREKKFNASSLDEYF